MHVLGGNFGILLCKREAEPCINPGEWCLMACFVLQWSEEFLRNSWPKVPGKYFYLCCWNYYCSVISLIFFAVRLDCKCFGAGRTCLWKPLRTVGAMEWRYPQVIKSGIPLLSNVLRYLLPRLCFRLAVLSWKIVFVMWTLMHCFCCMTKNANDIGLKTKLLWFYFILRVGPYCIKQLCVNK